MPALDREAREIRVAVTSLAATKRGRRFDTALECRVVRYARSQLAQGTSQGAICEVLDISAPTLSRFMRRAQSSSALVAVEVKPARAELVLRGPCGVWVTGDVDEVAALIARLACSG